MTLRKTTLATVALALALLAAPSGTAWAGDDVEGDSAAAQAFQAGWWAETSEGKLDVALERYQEAASADGPASVKARAFYRMGVVLHRMGQTQKAIQALERLAKEHPGEADLQAKAKERLEEWTAVDLKTDFDEWYERYQYSPEFQARIVELVLTLGSATAKADVDAARSELLTIGAPTLPALRAHVDSSNQDLRSRAADTLMQLGEIPPADVLVETRDWMGTTDNWSLLLRAPVAKKQALLAGLGNREDAALLRVVLGPETGWPEAYRLHHGSAMLRAMLAEDLEPATVAGLKALVGTFDDRRNPINDDLAEMLFRAGYVTDAELVQWLANPSWRVADYVAALLGQRAAPPDGTFEAVLARMDATAPHERLQRALFVALIAGLGDEPSEARLAAAMTTVERAWTGRQVLMFQNVSYSGGPPAYYRAPRTLRLLETIVEQATDPELVRKAMDRWYSANKEEPFTARTLLRWARMPLDPDNRMSAAKMAGRSTTSATLDELLKAIPQMEPAVANQVWWGLEQHRALQGLGWGDERFLRVMAIAAKTPLTNRTTTGGTMFLGRLSPFLQKLLGSQHRVEQLVRLALQVPWRIPSEVIRTIPTDLRTSRAIVAQVRAGFPTAWHDGNLRAKRAMLEIFPPLWGKLADGDELATFLRQQVRARWSEQSTPEASQQQHELKEWLLGSLPKVELDDVKAVYDFALPDQAAEAAVWLPLAAEAYDAVAAGRQAGEDERWSFWDHWEHAEDLELKRRVFRDMAADPDPHWRVKAVEMLGSMRNGKDVVVLRKALRDPTVEVRRKAAKMLALVYDKSAIKALVHALEDDDPTVRDAVLETLDAIKAIEQKKEYWRRAVREDGTMPEGD